MSKYTLSFSALQGVDDENRICDRRSTPPTPRNEYPIITNKDKEPYVNIYNVRTKMSFDFLNNPEKPGTDKKADYPDMVWPKPR